MHRFSFVPDLNLIVSDFGALLDDANLLQHLMDTYDHTDFRPGMDELLCFLRTSDLRVTAQGLRELARMFPRHQDHGAKPNYVAVVTDSQLGQGLSRMYGGHADRGGQVMLDVFPSLDPAADWLDRCRGRRCGTTAPAARRVLDAFNEAT